MGSIFLGTCSIFILDVRAILTTHFLKRVLPLTIFSMIETLAFRLFTTLQDRELSHKQLLEREKRNNLRNIEDIYVTLKFCSCRIVPANLCFNETFAAKYVFRRNSLLTKRK